MSKPWSQDLGAFRIGSGQQPEAGAVPRPDVPFRILILGDFGGTAHSREAVNKSLSTRLVDRDNLDSIMQAMRVRTQLMLGGDAPLDISFSSLEDFHPDRLFERLDVFKDLHQLRRRLENPSSFENAARELRSWGRTAQAAPKQESKPAPAANLTPEQVLQQILESSDDTPQGGPPQSSQVEEFIRKVVAPYVVADIEAEQDAMIAQVDTATSELMRQILHNPRFQEIEAAWRGVAFLVQRLETDGSLQLHLLDISQDELSAVLAADDLSSTPLYKVLVEETVGTPGGEPWAVILGNYTFSADPAHVQVLQSMARLAAQAGAPFIAGASPRIFGCTSLGESADPHDWTATMTKEQSEAWQALREHSDASFLGLLSPRFLLRAPYGKSSTQTEEFEFEEMPASPNHDDYLWGNSAFLCALLLGQDFTSSTWEMRPGDNVEVKDLPLHIFVEDGEKQVKPCAEAVLSDRAIERILDCDIMPVASFRNRNIVHVVRIQSLAEPPTALAGRWR